MADTKVNFYIQREGGYEYDLETSWKMTVPDINEPPCGILYSKCDGLFDKGKRVDIHTETYADSDEMRVWIGEKILREPTTITLSLYFTGRHKGEVFDSFMSFLENSKLYYWDTSRLKKAYMILKDAVTVKEDVHKGSIPYMLVDFKFQNLWGECKNCDANGNIK